MIRYSIEIFAGFVILAIAMLCRSGNGSQEFSLLSCDESSDHPREIPVRLYSVVICALLTAFAFLLFHKVSEIPLAYNVDEAGMAYDAVCMAEYGVDRYLYRFPVYLNNYGQGQSVLYMYLTALLIRLFGYSVLIVRLPAVLLSLAAALVFTRMMRKAHGDIAAVTVMGLFCILPFSIMHSRWALDAYLLFPMTVISCSVLYEAVMSGKTRLFVYAGILLGITLYTYAISYLFIVLFLTIYILYLLYAGQIRWKQLAALGLPLFFFALPLLAFLAVNNGLIDEIITPYLSVPKIMDYRSGEVGFRYIIPNLRFNRGNILYKLFFFDQRIFNSIPRFGTMYYFSLPLILAGLVYCLRMGRKAVNKKNVTPEMMMLCLFLAAFITSLLLSDVNVNKSCEIYFPLMYFLSVGITAVCRKKKTVAFLICGIYLLLFSGFVRYYFTEFPRDIDRQSLFGSISDLGDALRFTDGINTEKKPVYIIGRDQSYTYLLLEKQIDPFTFAEKKIMNGNNTAEFEEYRFLPRMTWDNPPEGPIYIFRNLYDIPWAFDSLPYETELFNTVKVYYPRRWIEK